MKLKFLSIIIFTILLTNCNKEEELKLENNFNSNYSLIDFYKNLYKNVNELPKDKLENKLSIIKEFKEAIYFIDWYEFEGTGYYHKDSTIISKQFIYNLEGVKIFHINFNFVFSKIDSLNDNSFILTNIRTSEYIPNNKTFNYYYASHNFDYDIDIDKSKIYSNSNIIYNIRYQSENQKKIIERKLEIKLDSIYIENSIMKYKIYTDTLNDEFFGKYIFK